MTCMVLIIIGGALIIVGVLILILKPIKDSKSRGWAVGILGGLQVFLGLMCTAGLI